MFVIKSLVSGMLAALEEAAIGATNRFASKRQEIEVNLLILRESCCFLNDISLHEARAGESRVRQLCAEGRK